MIQVEVKNGLWPQLPSEDGINPDSLICRKDYLFKEDIFIRETQMLGRLTFKALVFNKQFKVADTYIRKLGLLGAVLFNIDTVDALVVYDRHNFCSGKAEFIEDKK